MVQDWPAAPGVRDACRGGLRFELSFMHMRAVPPRRFCWVSIALTLLWLLVGGPELAAQPVNDNYTNSLTLAGIAGSATRFSYFGVSGGNLNNTRATKEPGEPNHAGNLGGQSVWFNWTPPITGLAAFSAPMTSSFGRTNLIAVYTGFGQFGTNFFLNSVADNSAGFGTTVSFPVVAGTTYSIAVDGYNSTANPNNATAFQFGVAWSILTNDFFANSTVLVGSSGYNLTNSNVGATFEAASGETDHSGDPSLVGGQSVWFSWTAPLSGPATFNVGYFTTLFSTPVMAIYTGTNLGGLTMVTNNNLGLNNVTNFGFFTNSVTFDAVAGTTYRIAVDGLFGAQDTFTLSYTSTVDKSAGTFQFNTNYMAVTEFESSLWGQNNSNNEERGLLGAVVTFTRTNGATGRMMIYYTTADGTAQSGFNYQGTNGVLILDDWQMYGHILIPIYQNSFFGINNFISTNDSYFQVLITNVVVDTNVIAGSGISYTESTNLTPTFDATPLTVQINNVALAGSKANSSGIISFAKSLFRCSEDANTYDVTLYRAGGDLSTTATVRYNISSFNGNGIIGDQNIFPLTAGSDYAQATQRPRVNEPGDFTAVQGGTVTFAASDPTATIRVTIIDDNEVELNEDIYLSLISDFRTGSLSPNPQPGTTPGYLLGSQNTAILTIVMEDNIAQEQPAGAQDNTYNRANDPQTTPPFNPTPGANNVVHEVAVQPDQSAVIVGEFTAVNTTPRNGVARVLPDGSLDLSFNPGSGADGFVNAVALQPDGSILIAGGFSSYVGVSRNGVARLLTNGALDTTFDPGIGINPGDTVNNAIQSILLQPDGRIILAGNFTTFNSQPFNHVVRLNADGSVDNTFAGLGAGPNDVVFATALYTTNNTSNSNLVGKILIAGSFATVNNVPSSRLCRLNADGSVDSTFTGLGAGADADIHAITIQKDGKILIGGDFSRLDIYDRRGLARLNMDGSVDSSFSPGSGVDDAVYALALQPDGRIFIGGLFTSYHGTRRMGIARVLTNGSLDTTFMDTVYNQFAGLTQPLSTMPRSACFSIGLETNGNVVIGGDFTRVGGGFGRYRSDPTYGSLTNVGTFTVRDYISTRLNFTRLIGVTDTPGPGNLEFLTDTYTADEFIGTYYVQMLRSGGWLGQSSVNFQTSDGTAVGAPLGAPTAGYDFLHTNAAIIYRSSYNENGAPDDRRIFDSFSGLSSRATNGPGSLNIGGGGSGVGFTNAMQSASITIIQDTLVEGNEAFTGTLTIPPLSATNAPIVYLGGAPIAVGVALGRDKATFIIADDDFAYGVLTFTSTNYVVSENVGVATITVARTNGSTGNISVRYAALFDSTSTNAAKLTEFTPVSGTLSFAPGQTNRSFSVTIVDDTIVNVPPSRTIRLTLTNATGGATIAVGGGLSTLTIVDNEPPAGTPAGSVNTAFGNAVGGGNDKVVAATYITNTLSGQGLNGRWVIAGDFTTVDSLPRNRIAMLNVDGSANTTIFNRLGTGPDATVSALGIHPANAFSTNYSGRIVVGGYFTQVNGTNRSRIARLNPDGSLDASFNPGSGADNPVLSIAIQPDQKIIIAGDFTTVNGNPRNRIARLNADGSVDATFNPGQGASGTIRAVVLDATGTNIYIAGDFTAYDGVSQNHVARLRSNGSLDSTGFVNPNDPNSGADARVRGLALDPAGNLLIVGDFSKVNGNASQVRVGRMFPDGTADPAFAATADNTVLTVAVDVQTNIVIGGDFATVNGLNRTRIARLLSTGQLDATINFGTGPNNFVAALALEPVTNGVITIGGGFTQVDGSPRSYFAQLVGGQNIGIGTVQFLSANFNVQESAGNALITVRRVGGLTNGVSVDYTTLDGTAVSPTHYASNSGTLFFQQGEAVRVYTVAIADGVGTNVDRLFTNILLNPTNYDVITGNNPDPTVMGSITNATVTIQDNDSQLGFAFDFYNVNENVVGGNAVISVVRLGAPVGNVSVNYLATNGTAVAGLKYTAVSGQLNFTNGQTATTFLVPIINGTTVEGTKTVMLTLANASPANVASLGRSSATLNIIDDDFSPGTFVFNQVSYDVQENGGPATITVIRTNGFTGLVTVQYASANGSAKGYNGLGSPVGFDYTNAPGSLTFGDGETVKTFNVGIIDNAVADLIPNRTVNLSLLNPTGGAQLGAQSTAVLTIHDDELSSFGAFTFSQTAYSVVETNTVAAVVVNRTGGSINTVTVDFSTGGGTASNGTNFLSVTQTLTFTNGQLAANVFVPIIYNPAITGDKTVNLILSNPTGGAALGSPSNAVLTIADAEFSPGVLTFGTNLFSVSENATNVIITVIRTNGFTGLVSVDYGVSNLTAMAGVDFTANVSGTLVFTNNVSTQSFAVPIIDNLTQEGNRLFEVRLFNGVNAALGLTNATVRIVDNESAAGSLDATFVTGAGANGDVFDIGLNASGSVFVVGDFTAVNGVARTNVARLSAGGVLDPTYTPDAIVRAGTNATVRAVGVYLTGTNAGKIVIGGAFDTVGGLARTNIARLNPDGTVDSSFNAGTGPDNAVYAMNIQSDGKILIGGFFTLVNGVNRSFIARLNVDGSLDNGFTPGAGADGPVRGIATDPSGRVFIVGDFASVDSVARNRIARLNSDGTVDKTFDPGIGADGSISAVGVNAASQPIVGGVFTNVNGLASSRLARFNVNGVVDATFAVGTGADEFVSSLAIQPDGKVVIGGGFTSVNGLPRSRITRLNGDGSVDATFNVGSGANDVVSVIRFQPADGSLLVGGAFTVMNGTAQSHLARLIGGTNLGFGSFDFLSPTFVVAEYQTNAVITVVRSGGTSNTVSVDFATADGTATDGFDYGGTNGTLVFGQGVALRSFLVPVIDNIFVDGNRTVNLMLSNPQGGSTLGSGASAVITILDDDSVLGFNPQAYSVNENGGAATIIVSRAGGTIGTVSVGYYTGDATAVAGVDYVAVTNGVLTFTNGQTTATFPVNIIDNLIVDGNRTLNLFLTNVVGKAVIGGGMAVLTIVDNEFAPGVLQFNPAAYTVAESSTNVTLTVTRTTGRSGVVSVSYAMVDGTATNGLDFIGQPGVLNFGDGETVKTITVPMIQDNVFETDETFQVVLSNPTGGALLGAVSNAVVTITDVVLGFPTNNFIVNEAAVNGIITIFRANPNNTNNSASVTFATVPGGTAIPVVDYTPTTQTVTFASGELSKTVLVPLVDDLIGRGSRTVFLQLTNTTGGASLARSSAVMTIEDNDPTLVDYVWSSGNAIILNDGTMASPYPSLITVVGVPGAVSNLSVTLSNFTHSMPSGLDLLLVGPQGQGVVVMSAAGGTNAVSGVTFTLDDLAPVHIPQAGPLVNATYKTTSYATTNFFPAPAPAGPYGADMSVFYGSNPNGVWRLYAVDEVTGAAGLITNGWSLKFSMLVPALTNDLVVAVSGSADTVNAGSNYTYTAVVFNTGSRPANNVTLFNVLSPGLVVNTITPSQGTVITTNGVLVHSVGVIPVGGAATLRLNVTPLFVGTASDSVSVIGAEFDNNLANNSAVQTTSVVPAGTVITGPNGFVITPTTNLPALTAALIPSGSGLTVSSTSVSAQTRPGGQSGIGTFTAGSGSPYTLSGTGIILSSGDVSAYGAGPNSSTVTFAYGTPATAAQEALLRPISGVSNHFDVAEFDVVFDVGSNVSRVAFEVVYGSEEYPVFVGSSFVDPFGLYLNGVNIAFTPDGNPVNIHNPGMTNLAGTELNGVLVVGGSAIQTFSAPVTPGSVNNRLTFIVGDAFDSQLDTTVYISGLRAVVAPPVDGSLQVTTSTNTVVVGDSLTYTIAVNNNSSTNALTGVVLTNPLPVGAVFQGAATSQGTAVQSNGLLTAVLGNIGPSQSAFVTLTVGAASVGALTNVTGLTYLSSGLATNKTSQVITPVLERLTTFYGGSFQLTDVGPAFTYPATINVLGLTGVVDQVSVTLSNLSHTFPADFDILLVGPQGQSVLLMSDCGANFLMTNATLTFSANVTNYLPASNSIVTGTYLPTDYSIGPPDVFMAPAPAGPYSSSMSVFSNTDPNGLWKLFIVDDQGGDAGSIAGGWSLTFTSTVAPSAPPVAPPMVFQYSPGVISLSWPTNAVGFALESSQLGKPVPVWTTVPLQPAVVGSNFNVTINTIGGPLYFRLRHP